MKLVFVSHATADGELVEQFVDIILRSCGLAEADIFVSSIPGMDIPAGSDLLAAVRAEVSDTTLVIAMIASDLSDSPCLRSGTWSSLGSRRKALAGPCARCRS